MYVTKDGAIQLIDDATFQFWNDQGWEEYGDAPGASGAVDSWGYFYAASSLTVTPGGGNQVPTWTDGEASAADAIVRGTKTVTDDCVVIAQDGKHMISVEFNLDVSSDYDGHVQVAIGSSDYPSPSYLDSDSGRQTIRVTPNTTHIATQPEYRITFPPNDQVTGDKIKVYFVPTTGTSAGTVTVRDLSLYVVRVT